uniref:RNA-directed RNA polymerase n=1 Tax=Beihai levi-like virus 30 TaxID=1922417 RepID=A0A1L3KI88_9VIRU|nr:hypothetical protein [Beihai levi-like virus 30]
MNQPKVDSNIFSAKDQKTLRCKMALELFKNGEHLFSIAERNKIVGSLRRGDLAILESDLILHRLDEAKQTGNLTTHDFSVLYQLYSFVRKAPTAGDDKVCRDAGFRKMLKGEEKCRVTNMTMSCRIKHNFALFDRVKMIIERILGPLPNDFLTSKNTEIFFGPGSSVNVNNRSFEETALFYKLSDKLVVPAKAKLYLAALVSNHPNWVDTLASHYHTQQNSDESRLNFERRVFRKHFVVVPDNNPSRIGFVPKSSEEHRAIGIEMNGLMPLQKVVGDLIRDRLKVVGINLDSQERNRHLARLAKTFQLATIDLANASSSISLELVRALLPYDWFTVINDFRSEVGYEPNSDTTIVYEMVSSMGNGFTFELESLIFYALAVATCEEVGISKLETKRSISVFGDDIIIPQRAASQLMGNLTLFGFTANVEKSFLQGFFFESCGSDYYNCTDVRPFFLKRDIVSIHDVYFLLNSLLFRSIKQGSPHLFSLYRWLFRQLARKAVDLGPLHFEFDQFGKLSNDDLESCLRVPLSYAQANGGVKFDPTLFAYRYKKWVRVAVESSLGQSPQYAVMHMRYLTFLKGQREGKVLLRGRTKIRQQQGTTSQWDGVLPLKEIRLVKYLFDSLSF